QEVTFSVTRRQLERARTWLKGQASEDPKAELAVALEAFKSARQLWNRSAKPSKERRETEEALVERRRQLSELEPIGTEDQPIDPAHASILERLEEGLSALLDILEEAGKAKLAKVERAWKHFEEGPLAEAKARQEPAAERI